MPLLSSGEVPVFLETAIKHQSISANALPVLGKRTRNEILEQKFLESGTILYGDEVTLYCQSVMDELISEKQMPSGTKIHTVKSNVGAVFSLNNGVYFVTTGLLAQMTSEVDLKFFILREFFHRKNSQELVRKEWRNGYATEELIKALTNYTELQETEADKYAGEELLKSGINEKTLIRCLDVLFFADQPFADQYVPLNYFSSDLMYVPLAFFGATSTNLTLGQEIQSVKERDKLYKSRKEALQTVLGTNITGSPDKLASDTFLKMQMKARMQVVHDKIIARCFYEALYDIFLLEQQLPESDFLKRMKAHAWYGLVYSDFGLNRRPLSKKTSASIQAESSSFFKALTVLRSHGRALFALRIITDMLNASSSASLSLELKSIREEIILVLAESKRFPIEKCSTSPLLKVGVNGSDSLLLSKYEKLEELRNNQIASAVDTNAFYYFAISDLMNDPEFVNHFRESKVTENKQDDSPLFVISTKVLHYKRKKVSEAKSKKLSDELQSVTQSLCNSQSSSGNFSQTDAYNEWSLMRSVVNQSQNYNALQGEILPVDMESIKLLEDRYGQGKLMYIQFDHSYSLVPKGYHFFGLLVVPLPFMLADLIIGGNDLRYTASIVNTKTGKLEYIEYSQSKNAVNPIFFKTSVENTLTNLIQKK